MWSTVRMGIFCTKNSAKNAIVAATRGILITRIRSSCATMMMENPMSGNARFAMGLGMGTATSVQMGNF